MPATVLVVEDEVLIRFMVADYLREAGYRVIESANADDAVAVLHNREPIDVLLSDIRVPGSLNGLDLARLVRSESPTTKIVLTSGHLSDIGSNSHDLFFAKPFDPARLIRGINGLLASRGTSAQVPR